MNPPHDRLSGWFRRRLAGGVRLSRAEPAGCDTEANRASGQQGYVPGWEVHSSSFDEHRLLPKFSALATKAGV
jgi:hypothetical protein